MDLECADDVGRLLDTCTEYPSRDRQVLRQRVVQVLGCAETVADRTEAWDTAFFTAGFGASLLVTLATAINLAKFMTPKASETLSTVIIVLSSLGTAALALRERLKFKETALLNRRTSSAIQRASFLFMARAGPYAIPDQSVRYVTFFQDVEAIKAAADQAHLRIRDLEDSGGGGGGGGGGAGAGPAVGSAVGVLSGGPPAPAIVPSTIDYVDVLGTETARV
jgi:hypothetical protein